MIIETLVIGSLFYGAHKSCELDEKALRKYARAFERSEEAELLVRNKADFADKRLVNVVKKKKAIIQNTVPKFVDVYGQIQKIDLEQNTKVNEITARTNIQQLADLECLSIATKREFTDKEWVCGLLTKGLPGMFVKDSEQYLSAAKNQMRASNVAYSQAKSIGELYDAIAARADRISKLLMAMNALFVGSINETSNIIQKNGLNVRNYSTYEKGVLMTCVNIAVAVSDIINVPVVDQNGQICESAMDMIVTGEKYIQQMNRALLM